MRAKGWRCGGVPGVLLALVLALAGCNPLAGHPPLRIATDPWPGWGLLRLAEARGFFADAGVSVRLLELGSPSDVRQSFASGHADGMGGTLAEVLALLGEARRRPRVVLVTDSSLGADVLLGWPPVDTVAGLRGRRVAVERGSLGTYLLARALDAAGMSAKDVRVESLDRTQLEEAVMRGEVDAVATAPPQDVPLRARSGARVLFSSADIPGEIVDVLAFDAAAIRTRATEIAAVVRAIHRAQRWAAVHAEEAQALMARRDGNDAAAVRMALAALHVPTLAEQRAQLARGGALERVGARLYAVMARSGEVAGPPRMLDLVAPEVLELAGLP